MGKTDRKSGGQFGHKGTTLTDDEIKKLIDDKKVKHRIVEVSKEEYKVKYVIDVEVTTVVTEYVVKDENNNEIEINKPGNPVVYGDNIKTISCLLFNHAKTSTDNVVSFISDLTGNIINLSKRTIINWQHQLYLNLKPEREHTKQQLLNSHIIHVDITTIKINGVKFYVHNISTTTHTYQTVHVAKGYDDMEEQGVIKFSLYFTNKRKHFKFNVQFILNSF